MSYDAKETGYICMSKSSMWDPCPLGVRIFPLLSRENLKLFMGRRKS